MQQEAQLQARRADIMGLEKCSLKGEEELEAAQQVGAVIFGLVYCSGVGLCQPDEQVPEPELVSALCAL